MKFPSVPILLVLVSSFSIPAIGQDSQPVTVHIRAALFDRDLNLKPVPRLLISLRSLDAPATAPVEARTSLDGTAEVSLAPGKYQLSTASGTELFGKIYRWDIPVTVSAGSKLVELSNDNATTADAVSRSAHVDELMEQFQRVRGAAVLVETLNGVHDGVLMDDAGLVLTSHIPADQQQWIAVEFDEKRSLPGQVIAEDEKNEASIVRINMEKVKDVTIPLISYDPGALVEGERVFSLNNDLKTGKSIRTGVVSKADEKGIVGDLQFTDMGSPLFNSTGTLVGYSRYENRAFRAVPLSNVREMLTAARAKAKDNSTLPSSRLLPVSPGKYPADVLIARHDPKYESDVYSFKMGDFKVYVGTPVAAYQSDKINFEQARKASMKRASKGGQPEELKEPTYEYDSVIEIEATPDYKVPFWSNMGRQAWDPVVLHLKSSFDHMRLLCGDQEIEPIRRSRYGIRAPQNGGYVFDQGSMLGRYSYTPDSLPPSCGTVTLELYSTDHPEIAVKKAIENPLRDRLWQDFEPFRRLHAPAITEALQK
jgi:hypothetical protein